MPSILLAFSLAFQGAAVAPTTPAASSPAAPVARTLATLPNVTVNYYNVAGKDMKEINKSIEKRRPKNPETGKIKTGGTNWTLKPSFRKTTTNGVCKITEVTTEFTAKAELPRHGNPSVVPAAVLRDWNNFQAELERDAAARLWFVYDRIDGLKQTMMGKDCDQAVKEGAAFLEQLKADAAAFQPRA